MWPDLIQKAKEGGLDVIETYVFWNGHEPSPGNVITKQKIYFFFFFTKFSSVTIHISSNLSLFLFFASIILGTGMIWLSLSSWCTKLVSMLISELALMFVLNGILGKYKSSNFPIY